LQGQGSSIAYAQASGGNCLTKSLARAFAPEVRVNAVAPGPVLTRWLAGREELVNRFVETTPLRRAAAPDDIADAVGLSALHASLMTDKSLSWTADGRCKPSAAYLRRRILLRMRRFFRPTL